MKNIAILCMTKYPLPAIKGGAVETLTNILLDKNEKDHTYNFHIYTFYDKEAGIVSKQYKYSVFHYIKKNIWIRLINKGIQVISIIFKRKCQSIYYKEIRNMMRGINFDSIILETSPYYASFLKKDFPSSKIIQHIHNIPDYSDNDKYIDKYLCISKFIQEKVLKNCNADPKKVNILYNTVDTNRFKPLLSQKEKTKLRLLYNLEPDDFIVIFSGRLQPFKGIKELMLAMEGIRCPKIKLLIVGSSFFSGSKTTSFINELKDIALRMENRVIFTGYVPYSEIHRCYQIADIAVFPSLWEEPFGLTCLEAIASGLPVIITQSGGMNEIINGNCGFIVEKKSNLINHITELILLLERNAHKRIDMGHEAVKRAYYFDIENYWKTFKKLINNEK